MALCLLLWSILESARATGRTLTRLVEASWHLYLGGNNPPVVFFFLCLGDDTCSDAFVKVWLQEYPLILPLLAFVFIWAGAVFSVLAHKKVKEKSPGGADWAKAKDLKRYFKGVKGSPQRGYFGVFQNGRMLQVPERLRCAHTLVLGATGARKSTAYHKPNMVMDALDDTSAIIIDLKYPDVKSGFFDMVSFFASAGHDVQLFLPYGEHTLRFPLLAGTDSLEGASEVADMIAPDTDKPEVDFYRGEERRLLTGLLMALARDRNSSLGELYRLLQQGRSAVQSYIHKHPDAEIRQSLSGFFDLNLSTQGNLIGGLAGKLQAFADSRLDKATTLSPNPKENIDLEAIGLDPTLLYIGIPQEHLQGTKAKMLLKLIKRAIDLALLKTANANEGQLPNHVSFYLDEFANLGVLPNIAENFATMRSRRVAYHVSLQNRAQGEALYGKEQFRSFFTNNFGHVLFFPHSLKFEDAEYFSKALGDRLVMDKLKGVSREGPFSSQRKSEQVRYVAEPLLSPEAMRLMPEEEAILIASGIPPVKVRMPRLDERKVLGTRNPLYPFYKKFATTLKPKLLAEILIMKRLAKGSRQLESATPVEEKSIPSSMSQNPDALTSDFDEAGAMEKIKQAQPEVVEKETPTPQQRFLEWLGEAMTHPISVKLHTNPKTKQLSKVSLLGVSSSLENQNELELWIQKGWVKLSSQEIGLVGEGLRLVGKKRFEELKALCRAQPADTPSVNATAQSSIRPEDIQKLRQYIQSVGHLLQGHPLREQIDSEDSSDVIGLYQPCTVLLDKGVLEKLLSAIPDKMNVRKEGASGDQRWVVELPLEQLEHYPELKAWCKANWHRLKGHPNFETSQSPAQDVGMFLPETVALPKQVITELLGAIPKQGKPTRPHLAGKRPQLIALELPFEA